MLKSSAVLDVDVTAYEQHATFKIGFTWRNTGQHHVSVSHRHELRSSGSKFDLHPISPTSTSCDFLSVSIEKQKMRFDSTRNDFRDAASWDQAGVTRVRGQLATSTEACVVESSPCGASSHPQTVEQTFNSAAIFKKKKNCRCLKSTQLNSHKNFSNVNLVMVVSDFVGSTGWCDWLWDTVNTEDWSSAHWRKEAVCHSGTSGRRRVGSYTVF